MRITVNDMARVSGGETERSNAALTAMREDTVGKNGIVPVYGGVPCLLRRLSSKPWLMRA